MSSRRKKAYVIEIRDKRLRGGRLCISARTTSRPEWRRRDAAVRALLERGEIELIERLRRRDIHIADVVRAVEEGDLDRIRRPLSEPLTLGACVERFLRTVEATRAPGTAEAYRKVCRRMLEQFGPDRPLDRITAAEIEEWLHAPRPNTGRPWAANSQRIIVATGKRLWNQVIAREREAAELSGAAPRIKRNPWTMVELPDAGPGRVAFLEPEDWRRVLAVTRGTPRAAFLALGCYAGLRIGEAAHLRMGVDLDLDARVIHVQPRGGDHPWRPKTRNSIRDVPVSDELYAVLMEHIRLGYAGERYVIRPAGHDRPVAIRTLATWTKEAFEAAGLRYGRSGDGLTYHSLRHTFASWLARADVQLQKIAMLLGDTVEIVSQVYAHLLPRDLDQAVRVIDRTVREAR